MGDQDELVQTELYVGGTMRPAEGDRTYELFNPARPSELVGQAAAASCADVEEAVQAAHGAFPQWSSLSHSERAEKLRAVAASLNADEDDVSRRSRLFTREHGKIIHETLLEMSRLGDRFMQAAAYSERLGKDEEIAGPPFDTLVMRQARGVAALIVPWNWPLSILGAKLPQALIAGNTVVVKPSQSSALAPMQTLQIIADILPPGVVNVLSGSAGEIGDALVSHPLVRTVNFTGSVVVGRHVM